MSIVEPGWALASPTSLFLPNPDNNGHMENWRYNIKSRYQIKENWFALKLSPRQHRSVAAASLIT